MILPVPKFIFYLGHFRVELGTKLRPNLFRNASRAKICVEILQAPKMTIRNLREILEKNILGVARDNAIMVFFYGTNRAG